MAQNQDAVASPSCMISNEDCNGLRICKRDISIELLTIIFCYLDHKTLLNCQLVCKRWKMIIQNYVWWKKTGLVLNKLFSHRENLPWQVFYLIYKKNPPFERKNLLKNHSGEENFKYWDMSQNTIGTLPHYCWKIENPPSGMPELTLTESIFEGKQYCFASFYDFIRHSGLKRRPIAIKIQQIDVVSEGFDPYILDVLQPPFIKFGNIRRTNLSWLQNGWSMCTYNDSLGYTYRASSSILISFHWMKALVEAIIQIVVFLIK